MGRLNIISRCQALYRAEQFPSDDLKPSHHTLILNIAREPGLSQDQIAKRVCLNKSGVARGLNYLEEHGYVTRLQSETDKRVIQVYPTDKLMEVLPRIKEIGRAWNESLSADFSDEEMDIFLDVLARMATRAKELVGQTEREE